MEVIFVKVKHFQVEGDWATTRMAIKYDEWTALQVSKQACPILHFCQWCPVCRCQDVVQNLSRPIPDIALIFFLSKIRGRQMQSYRMNIKYLQWGSGWVKYYRCSYVAVVVLTLIITVTTPRMFPRRPALKNFGMILSGQNNLLDVASGITENKALILYLLHNSSLLKQISTCISKNFHLHLLRK